MFCDPLLVILRHPLTIPLPAIPLHPSLNPILLMVPLNPTIFTFAMIPVLETSNSTLYSMGVSTGSHIPFQAASEQTGNASFGSTFLLIWTLQFCSTTNLRTSTKTIDDTWRAWILINSRENMLVQARWRAETVNHLQLSTTRSSTHVDWLLTPSSTVSIHHNRTRGLSNRLLNLKTPILLWT